MSNDESMTNFRFRYALFAVSTLARAAVVIAGCGLSTCNKFTPVRNNAVDPNGPVEVVIPEHGVYTGAYMDFGDEEDDVSLEIIEDFEQMVGKHQAIIASSS